MASAAALRFLPAHSVAGDEGAWPWALLKLSTVELVIPFILVCWLLCELVFFLFSRFLHWKLDKLTPPERSTIDPEQYVEKVMDIVDSVRGVYPFETFLTRWCGSETIQELKKGNVAQFLAWALFSKRVEDLLPRDYVMLHRMVEMVNRRFELNLEEGLNPKARTLRMTLEPLQVIHRPLFMYLCTTVFPRLFGNACLRLQGFEKFEHNETVYWYRAGREWPATQLPLVFFHGVSPGQCMYAGLTSLLSEGRTAVLVEIPHIAMSLEAFRAKTEEEVVADLRHILQRHGIRHCAVGGHSYGTIWAGWIVRALREQVKQAILLDPVCILLCLPNTPFNFLYRKPQDPPSHVAPAPSLLTFQGIKKRVFDYALHYVVSTELTIANAMRRQFWWHKKILHAEDLHCPAVVGLASEDILLSAPAINKYLRDHCAPEKLEIVWWQDFTHGELLASLPSQYALDQLVRAQEEKHYAGHARAWELPPHERPHDIAQLAALEEQERQQHPRSRAGTPSSPLTLSLSSSPARPRAWVSPSPTNAAFGPVIRQRHHSSRHRKRPLPPSADAPAPSGAGSNEGSPAVYHQYHPSSSSSLQREHSSAASSSVAEEERHDEQEEGEGVQRVPSEDSLDAQAAQLDGSVASSVAAGDAAVAAAVVDKTVGAGAGGVGPGGIPASEGGEAAAQNADVAPPSAGLVRTIWHAVWG